MNLKTRRILACAIDTFIYLEIIIHIAPLFDTLPIFKNIIIRHIDAILFCVFIVVSYCCKDFIFGYESIGKKF